MIGPIFEVAPEGDRLVKCQVDVRATAEGKGSARWDGATFKYYAGRDRSAPFDSIVVPASQVAEVFGGPITGGTEHASRWIFTVNAPFSISANFRYRRDDRRAVTSTVSFDCGPRVTTGMATPAIDDVSVESATPELEPGGTLTVKYTATSTAGIWDTQVLLSGPCEIAREFPEPLQPSAVHTVDIKIPATCELGAPVTVSIFATDAALQTSSRHVATGYTLVDKTPPVVTVWMLPGFGGSKTTSLSGMYFAGDTIAFEVVGWDNGPMAWIAWEALQGRIRDSVLVAEPLVSRVVRVPIPRDWTSAVDFRAYGADRAGLTSPIIATEPNAIRVSPTVDRPAIWTTLQGNVAEMVADPARGRAYLLQPGWGRVSVLSMSTLEVLQTIPVPTAPSSIDLTPSGDSLLVALAADVAIGVIDLRAAQPTVALIAVPERNTTVYQGVGWLRTASNGRAFAVVGTSDLTSTTYRLLEIDLRTGATRYRSDVVEGAAFVPGFVERPADHSRIAFTSSTCAAWYDTASDTFSTCRIVNFTGGIPSFDATGARSLAGVDLFDRSWQLVTRVQRPPGWGLPFSSALSPDAADVYFTIGDAGVARVRVRDNLIERIPNPIVAGRVYLAPDGRHLFTMTGLEDASTKISVIEVR